MIAIAQNALARYGVSGVETVPSGWKGPIAPVTQDCFTIGENGAGPPASWGKAGGQSYTPTGHIIYYNGNDALTTPALTTTGYAGGYIRMYAATNNRSGNNRVRVTRVSTGQIIYDQVGSNFQGGNNTVYIMHEINLPIYAAWHIEVFRFDGGGMTLYDIIWN